MAQQDSGYIPAFGLHQLTPYYDAFAGLFADTFRRRLLGQAALQPRQRVLDLGCGTGLLARMIKQSIPEARVTGLDGDGQVLNIARVKSRGTDIQWDRALAFDMPYPDASFDAVASSFVTHHLTRADKLRTFQEVLRVLCPGGGFHIVDFGPPFDLLTRIQAFLMRNLERTADNFDGRIVPILAEAGFESAAEAGHAVTFFGPVAFYRAIKGA